VNTSCQQRIATTRGYGKRIRLLNGAVTGGLAILLHAQVAAGQTARLVADFNKDGIDDLAVGSQMANNGAGGLSIFLGAPGIGFSKTTPDWEIVVLTDEGLGFGSAFAAADFNGDQQFELAVGEPAYNGGRGRVTVYSFRPKAEGPFGVVSAKTKQFVQGVAGLGGTAEADDRFGSAFAVGDFDGNGYTDLAVGVPGQDIVVSDATGAVHLVRDAGAVHVLYGWPQGRTVPSGLRADGNQIWSQYRSGVQGEPQAGDRFGFALAAGDFNGDRIDDLAVGVPFENGTYSKQGAVNIIYGTSGGLSPKNDQLLSPPEYESGALREAHYGYALAAGDINGDGIADLAIGAPGWLDLTGNVYVRYGTLRGLFRSLSQPPALGPGSALGFSLAVADFNGDGFADVAAGAPQQDVAGLVGSGAVWVFYGGSGGFLSGGQQWQQNSFGVRDKIEAGDLFGWALTAADYSGDGLADLAVGVPFEDGAGATSVLMGTPLGLKHAVYNHPSAQDLLVAGTRRSGAQFGAALTSSPQAR